MMKYLVLAAVLLVAYMVWRGNRLAARGRGAAPKAAPPALPQDMVACPVCGVHLPRSEAVASAEGVPYCSQDHLRLGGGAPR